MTPFMMPSIEDIDPLLAEAIRIQCNWLDAHVVHIYAIVLFIRIAIDVMFHV